MTTVTDGPIVLASLLIGEPAMVAFGKQLASACGQGAVIFLEGNLGMGKTTLCRGVLQGLGHKGTVKSPTYTLVEPYELENINAYHFDLYRLGDPEELEYMGIRDYFTDANLCLVEWPDKGRGMLPAADLIISIDPIDHGRQLKLRAATDKGKNIIACLN